MKSSPTALCPTAARLGAFHLLSWTSLVCWWLSVLWFWRLQMQTSLQMTTSHGSLFYGCWKLQLLKGGQCKQTKLLLPC